MQSLEITVDDSSLVRDLKVLPSEKRCKNCHRILPTADFYRDGNGKDGVQAVCKQCSNERNRMNKIARNAAKKAAAATNEATASAVRHVHPIKDTVGTIVRGPEAENGVQALPPAAPVPVPLPDIKRSIVAITNLTTATGNAAVNRRREVIAAVQLLLDMPENDCTAVIAMVQAYKSVRE